MEVAKARLKINSLGSDIPLSGVTPAEVQVLNVAHEEGANGIAVSEVEIVGSSRLTDAQELDRLKRKYPNLRIKIEGKNVNVVSHLYPGLGNKLPATFAEIDIVAPKAETGVSGPQTYNPLPDEESQRADTDEWYDKEGNVQVGQRPIEAFVEDIPESKKVTIKK